MLNYDEVQLGQVWLSLCNDLCTDWTTGGLCFRFRRVQSIFSSPLTPHRLIAADTGYLSSGLKQTGRNSERIRHLPKTLRMPEYIDLTSSGLGD